MLLSFKCFMACWFDVLMLLDLNMLMLINEFQWFNGFPYLCGSHSKMV